MSRDTGAMLVDLYEELPRNPEIYVDFMHHNNAGQRRKARIIQRVLVAEQLMVTVSPSPAG